MERFIDGRNNEFAGREVRRDEGRKAGEMLYERERVDGKRWRKEVKRRRVS